MLPVRKVPKCDFRRRGRERIPEPQRLEVRHTQPNAAVDLEADARHPLGADQELDGLGNLEARADAAERVQAGHGLVACLSLCGVEQPGAQVQLRGNRARQNAAHADLLRTELRRHHARQAFDRRLGGGIG